MNDHDKFNFMINAVMNSAVQPKVSQADFEKFEREWIFHALKDLRYGEAFCIFAGISNASPLYHFKDKKISERWIRDNYLIS